MDSDYPEKIPQKENAGIFKPGDEVKFFKHAIELAGDEVFLMKADSQIVYVNQSACDKLGYTADELIGMFVWEWDPLFTRDLWPELWSKIKHEKRVHFESKHRTKTGAVFPVEIRSHYYQLEGREFVLAFVYDITGRKKAQQELLNYQHHLEEKVAARTAELNEAIDKLQQQARIDELTKVYNRRVLNETIDAEWKRMSRLGKEMSFLMIDIDYFKLYNDHYGHPQGDECLISIANVLKKCVSRSFDTIARYGGEEFACILPETPAGGALKVAHLIQDAVKEQGIPHEASPVSPFVTVSIGVASCLPKDWLDSVHVIVVADKCLYQAKRNGRNQICSNVQ